MKFLFFLAVVAAVFLWLRSLVLRQGSRQDSTAGQGSSQASAPADSYANPYEPRDYDGGCRPQDADGVGGSDSDSSSSGDGGGSDGGGGSD